MKKKIANAVELIFLIGSFIILNINTITYFPVGTGSAFGCMQSIPILFIPMCAFYLLCTIMCVVSIISKNNNKDGVIHGILAIILFISANWTLLLSTIGENMDSSGFPTGLFELFLFLTIVVAFAKRSPLIVNSQNNNQGTTQPIVNNIQKSTSADELKKYKELLDSGVITQEEFEAKKKQLLNL